MLPALKFGMGKAIAIVMSSEIKLLKGRKKKEDKGVDDFQFDSVAFIFNIILY